MLGRLVGVGVLLACSSCGDVDGGNVSDSGPTVDAAGPDADPSLEPFSVHVYDSLGPREDIVVVLNRRDGSIISHGTTDAAGNYEAAISPDGMATVVTRSIFFNDNTARTWTNLQPNSVLSVVLDDHPGNPVAPVVVSQTPFAGASSHLLKGCLAESSDGEQFEPSIFSWCVARDGTLSLYAEARDENQAVLAGTFIKGVPVSQTVPTTVTLPPYDPGLVSTLTVTTDNVPDAPIVYNHIRQFVNGVGSISMGPSLGTVATYLDGFAELFETRTQALGIVRYERFLPTPAYTADFEALEPPTATICVSGAETATPLVRVTADSLSVGEVIEIQTGPPTPTNGYDLFWSLFAPGDETEIQIPELPPTVPLSVGRLNPRTYVYRAPFATGTNSLQMSAGRMPNAPSTMTVFFLESPECP